jgi:predicted nucleic acid-binding protein
MTRLLVSDTSVLIDLERGNLLQTTFKLSVPLAVPDVLYERELRANNGEVLRTLGLQVLSLSDAEVSLAQEYLGRARSLSIPDAFALALAKSGGHMLVCADRALKELADAEAVECHGLFWILDQIVEAGLLTPKRLRAALETIAGHPRCRLPKDLVAAYLTKFSK